MDPASAGASIGAALASFAATWRLLVVPAKNEASANIATLEAENKELRRRLDELAKSVDNLEAKVNRTVTTEEFTSHTSSTADALRTLSEKVGQAKGAIETWLSTIRR